MGNIRRSLTVRAEFATLEGNERILVPDYMSDPPISRDLFECVQRVLDSNADVHARRMHSKPEYMLTGLIRCGVCGRALHGYTHRGNRNGPYRMYRHDTARTKEIDRLGAGSSVPMGSRCPHTHRYVRAEGIETDVLSFVRAALTDERLLTVAREQLTLLQGERLEDRGAEIVTCEVRLAELKAQLKAAALAQQSASAKGNDVLASVHEEAATELSMQLAEHQETLLLLKDEDARFQAASDRLPMLASQLTSLGAVLEGGLITVKDAIRVLIDKVELDLSLETARLHVLLPRTGLKIPPTERVPA